MSDSSKPPADLRNNPRLKVPPMYTLIRVTQPGKTRATMTGHIYDVSTTGMRFELDRPIAAGTTIQARALLPGKTHTTVQLSGQVVRHHSDADDPGPARMAMRFDRTSHRKDLLRLTDYLRDAGLRAA